MAGRLPQASVNYSYTGLSETPVMKSNGQRVPVSAKDQYHWDITIAQPLFTGFALSSKLGIAKLDVVIRQMEKDQTILTLARDVKIACYRLLLAEKLRMVSEDEVQALTAHRHDSDVFYRQGLIPLNDLLEADVALANAVQGLARANADVKKAKADLNTLLNRGVMNPIRLEDLDNAPPQSFKFDPLGRAALENRPELKALYSSAEQLGLAEKLAKSSWYPEISLAGHYEQNGDEPNAGSNDYANSHNSSISIQATWTFWDSGKTRAEIAQARHDLKALEATIRTVENQIHLEVQNAILECEVAWENIGTASKALEQARENWRLTNMRFQQQVDTSTDVLDARSFRTQADTNYFRALYGYLGALAELDRSTGRKPKAPYQTE